MSDMKTLNWTTKKLARHVIIVLSVPSTTQGTWITSTDVTADCAMRFTLKEAQMQLTASVSRHRTPHSRTNFDKTYQLTGTVHAPARRPHFCLAIISVTVHLWTQAFWVISAYFNIRNALRTSGTFLLGHPVYMKGISCIRDYISRQELYIFKNASFLQLTATFTEYSDARLQNENNWSHELCICEGIQGLLVCSDRITISKRCTIWDLLLARNKHEKWPSVVNSYIKETYHA
jgi:hypothetical protein